MSLQQLQAPSRLESSLLDGSKESLLLDVKGAGSRYQKTSRSEPSAGQLVESLVGLPGLRDLLPISGKGGGIEDDQIEALFALRKKGEDILPDDSDSLLEPVQGGIVSGQLSGRL